jgi:hypothetical protein
VTLPNNVAGGTISGVATGTFACVASVPNGTPSAQTAIALSNTVSPQFCGTLSGLDGLPSLVAPAFFVEQLTSHAITQVVGPGQTIAVTVVITFSGV